MFGGEEMDKTVFQSVRFLSGVGPKRMEPLHDLGIDTIYDLLTHFPFRYEDLQVRDVSTIMDQEKVTLAGIIVTEPVVHYYGFKKNRISCRMAIGEQVIQVSFFNQPYLKNKLIQHQECIIFGKWDAKRSTLMGMKIISTKEDIEETSNFEAVYRTNKSIRQSTLLKLIQTALPLYKENIPNPLPASIQKKRQLLSHPEAVEGMHFPKDERHSKQSRQQLVYQELFCYQLKLQSLKKKRHHSKQGQSILYENTALKAFIQTLPFTLTEGQKKVVNEICYDLRAPYEMSRLLQGDVGSGKTVVATIAMVATALTGKQACLMVPTELLADQHYETICALTKETEIKVGKLTGTTTLKERRVLLEQLKQGELQILVGTHALFQEDVIYHDLAFIVIDEQHRFGVKQRAQLAQKGTGVNVLQMTATPIPRTLAITSFGEMDTSILKEAPKGRQPIRTFWVKEQELEKVYDYIEKQVQAGRQAYVISPLIEESENLDVQNATEIYEMISKRFENRLSVGLLHGRLKSDEKESVMTAFQKNDVQVLVSTTVIEVGVDVPNATVMVILDADRFGLAQLHQLRGRVGRGEHASTCILIASPKTEQGKQRMQIMCESTDGFYLSQKDLELRGSGDVFGLRQSGIPEFKVADIVQDYDILEQAREDAITFVIEEEDSVAYKEIQEFIEQTSRETEEIVNG